MNTTQVLTVMRDHTALRTEGQTVCACDERTVLGPSGHTIHLAKKIALASQLGSPSGPDRWVVRAAEIDGDHIGHEATFPVPGVGDVTGRLLNVGVWDTTNAAMVELTVHDPDTKRERAYIVRATAWVSLTSPR
jgi:hypothetical protein